MLCDLLGKLASRRQDQRGAIGARLQKPLQQWNPERGRLAASGWSAGEDVVAGQRNRNSLPLDGGGVLKMKLIDALKNGSIERKF
jgi:hypothetical protein